VLQLLAGEGDRGCAPVSRFPTRDNRPGAGAGMIMPENTTVRLAGLDFLAERRNILRCHWCGFFDQTACGTETGALGGGRHRMLARCGLWVRENTQSPPPCDLTQQSGRRPYRRNRASLWVWPPSARATFSRRGAQPPGCSSARPRAEHCAHETLNGEVCRAPQADLRERSPLRPRRARSPEVGTPNGSCSHPERHGCFEPRPSQARWTSFDNVALPF
jgi:hypothetical protein